MAEQGGTHALYASKASDQASGRVWGSNRKLDLTAHGDYTVILFHGFLSDIQLLYKCNVSPRSLLTCMAYRHGPSLCAPALPSAKMLMSRTWSQDAAYVIGNHQSDSMWSHQAGTRGQQWKSVSKSQLVNERRTTTLHCCGVCFRHQYKLRRLG